MPPRNFQGARFFLDLDGAKCGFLRSIQGGAVSADVLPEPGTTFFVKKHIGQQRFEEAAIEIGLTMNKPIYDWIAASWQKSLVSKAVTITAADVNNEAKIVEEFANCVITETTIPACDGSARDPGFLTVTLAPEAIRTKKGSGKVDAPSTPSQQKAWLPSNFRVDIPGLDCKKVSKIDTFTVKQQIQADDIGERRLLRKVSHIDFPNLRVTLAASSASAWEDWFDDFVIKGNCDDAHEKAGKLSLLSPTLDELASIQFFNLGIFRLAPERARPGGEQIDRVVAELYCERMEFHWGP